MDLSKQEMELFLQHLQLQPKNFFYKMFLTFNFNHWVQNQFENKKWIYPNRKWNYFPYFLISDEKNFF